jgi:ABC-type uncharacterized transport system substrate-binding protein
MVQGSKVYSYKQLSEMIQASRNGQIKLANNTIAHFTDNEQIAIRLHYTDVIIINQDNTSYIRQVDIRNYNIFLVIVFLIFDE